jgi:hypothetical protein
MTERTFMRLGSFSLLSLVLLATPAAFAQSGGTLPVYGAPVMFNAAPSVVRVFARDFNRDNIPDVAVISGPTPVTVYLGSGDGTFGLGLTSARGGQGGYPLIGDFNGDGTPDIAFREISDVVGGTSPIGVQFGNGNGTFQPYRAGGSLPYDTVAAAGDLDGDGKSDLAGSGCWGGLLGDLHCGIVFLWGRADGNFDRSELEIGGDIRLGGTLLSGDFNGDGKPDVVWRMWLQGKFVVLLGLGNRTFGSPIEHGSAGDPDSFAEADFNNDGKLDLAVRYGGTINTDARILGVLLGNGDGTFQPVTLIGLFDRGQVNGVHELKVWDFDSNGKPDIAIDGREGVVLLINNGDGSFRRYALTAGVGDSHPYNTPLDYGIADFNGDGRTDFVVAWTDNKVGVYLGMPEVSTALYPVPPQRLGRS